MNANQGFHTEVAADPVACSSQPTDSAAKARGTELADVFKQALGNTSGGRVLDVATAEGGFIKVLRRSLQHYETFVGVDHDAQVLKTAYDSFDQPAIHFVQMDGERLAFNGGIFDTVVISASMHHLDNGLQVLAEMKRVLKPAGRFVLAEMHRDGLSEAQLTTVYLHHWVADVDTALGLLHNRTLPRQRLVDYVKAIGLGGVVCYDWVDTQSDSMDKNVIERMEGLLEERTQSAREAPNFDLLQQRASVLRRRLRQLGTAREPVVVIVGEKL